MAILVKDLNQNEIIAKNTSIKSVDFIRTKTGCVRSWGQAPAFEYQVMFLADIKPFQVKGKVNIYLIDGIGYKLDRQRLFRIHKFEKSIDPTEGYTSTWGRQ